MRDWADMGRQEKTVRAGCAVALSAQLAACVRREDVVGAAIAGLSAVAALGLEAEEIRSVLQLLESSARSQA